MASPIPTEPHPLGFWRLRTAVDERLFKAFWLLTAFNLLFSLVRIQVTEKLYFFLAWNLFLGLIPLLMAYAVWRMRSGWLQLGFGLVWLAFLPNSPYIVSDLIHIRTAPPAILWWNVLAIFITAIHALYAGTLSLRWIHQTLLRRGWSASLSWAAITLAILACGFGIYLGRVLRWNSWDLVTRPGALFTEVMQSLLTVDPWEVSLLFSALFGLAYAVLTMIAPLSEPTPKP